MDEVQRWKLPEVTYLRLKLPPANGINSGNYDQYETVIETNEDDQTNNDRLLQVLHLRIIMVTVLSLSIDILFSLKKLERGEAENLAGRYFASNRANDIVTRVSKDLNRIKRNNAFQLLK